MQKQLEFIKTEIGVDASGMGQMDIEKLCQYALNCMALENPRIAAIYAREIGMVVTLGK